MRQFSELFEILQAPTPQEKLSKFEDFYEDFLSEKIIYDSYSPKIITQPSYSSFAKIIHPTRIRRAKALSSDAKLAATLHQIAHIEYSAIDLAIDASYRFFAAGGVLLAKDFLKIANDECRHFRLLNQALGELGHSYGDFCVHQNLFDAMVATNCDLRVRMGVVHRHLEACGLDANPFVLQKIKSSNHPIKSRLEEILNIILSDEITHVSAGDKWYKLCGGKSENFCKLLQDYHFLVRKIGVMNEEARKKSGYTQAELDEIKAHFG